jgi:CDGSH-type Zn-finger protein/uncharacterized Fe-S cluster protein YjdI
MCRQAHTLRQSTFHHLETHMSVETVTGRDATIHFDGQKCIHSRNCVLSHPDVFVPNVEGAWIYPDAQPVGELMHIAKSCPSGAIRVLRHDPKAGDASDSDGPPIVNTLRVRENGPLAIEGELLVRGEGQASPRATLCRCGHSANKPYCDGRHRTAGFVASGEPATASMEPLAQRNGPVDVQPVPNGPLRLIGNLEVVSGTGRTCNKVTETYLCRCGQSNNKPYCDGGHKAAGFSAP